MTTEELLQVRYKVIADYPCNTVYHIGRIVDGTGYEENFDKYPHLFKKLEWWEEREVADMPEYVKVENKYHVLGSGNIFKVISNGLWKQPVYGSQIYCNLENVLDNPYNYSDFIPAKIEEYNEYQKQTNAQIPT